MLVPLSATRRSVQSWFSSRLSLQCSHGLAEANKGFAPFEVEPA